MFTEDMIVGGGTVLNPKPETYSDFVRMLDDIENFISQELDKARAEGRREQRELDCSLYGSACAEENFDEKWKLEFGMTEERESYLN